MIIASLTTLLLILVCFDCGFFGPTIAAAVLPLLSSNNTDELQHKWIKEATGREVLKATIDECKPALSLKGTRARQYNYTHQKAKGQYVCVRLCVRCVRMFNGERRDQLRVSDIHIGAIEDSDPTFTDSEARESYLYTLQCTMCT
jgi:hypothetical protein